MTKTQFTRIGMHLLFWVAFWLVVSTIASLYDGSMEIFLVKLIEMPVIILATYAFSYGLIPLLLSKKIFSFIILTLFYFAVVAALRRLVLYNILFPLYYTENEFTFEIIDWYRIVSDLWAMLGVLAIFNAIRYVYQYTRANKRIQAITEEKKEAELRFLQAQIHPHFLFNTLNSIYYEVVCKSDKAPELIIKLSEILRFVLYELNNPTIPIQKEIQLVENYSELMKSRYGERLEVEILTKDLDGIEIPQMILFSITENAFKHGISDQSDHCCIEVRAEREGDHLKLSVRNTDSETYPVEDPLGSKYGIGMKNLERQLSLNYDDGFKLQSYRDAGLYICELRIPIAL